MGIGYFHKNGQPSFTRKGFSIVHRKIVCKLMSPLGHLLRVKKETVQISKGRIGVIGKNKQLTIR